MPFCSHSFRFFVILALIFSANVIGDCVFAQGGKADYERAMALRERFPGKVYNANISQHWFADGEKFTYISRLSDGRKEFVLVDAVKGERKPAFDHEIMAKELARLLETDVTPDKLPIDGIFFDEEKNAIYLFGKKLFRWDLATDTLTAFWNGETGLNLPPDFSIRASLRTGAATEIRFTNNVLGEPLRIFWIDTLGKERDYGTIGYFDTRVMQTYEGHCWVVRNDEGKIYGVYEAEFERRHAVITEPPENENTKDRRNEQRRQTPSRPANIVIQDHNVFLRNKDGSHTPVTTDGTPEHHYEGSVIWSLDGKFFVVRKTLQGDDRKVYYVESSPRDQLQPKLHSYNYLKPGDRIPLTKPHLFRVIEKADDGGVEIENIPICDELFPNPWSVSRIGWHSDGSRFFFLYNQRGHQVVRYLTVDAESGNVQTIAEEASDTFVDYNSKVFAHRNDETNELIWMSQRDGWNHLYLIDTSTGELKNPITTGPWGVRSIEKVDPEKRTIWFYAGGVRPEQDPYYLHYCRVDFDGQNFRVLTEGDGTHSIKHSPDRKYFIDTYSRVDMPPVHELRCMETGRLICSLETADHSELLAVGWQPPERFTAKGRDDETDIYGVIIRPTNFDPQKTYPVIEYIYAGPHDSFVPKGFSEFYGMQTIAELGFVLVQIDGMGTNNRSKAFHDVCWQNLGDSGFPDRIRWIRAAAEKHPYMDISRVGIYGGSAGGQSSLRALLAHGDFYKVAVSDCGCHDNRVDKIWWNEQWMGWPIGPHYEEQSNVTQAHRLEGKLLLIVGEMDENVDPASTMQVVNALIKADKDFDLLIMTGTGHGSAERPYASRRRMDFFVRHLLGVEPRWEP